MFHGFNVLPCVNVCQIVGSLKTEQIHHTLFLKTELKRLSDCGQSENRANTSYIIFKIRTVKVASLEISFFVAILSRTDTFYKTLYSIWTIHGHMKAYLLLIMAYTTKLLTCDFFFL